MAFYSYSLCLQPKFFDHFKNSNNGNTVSSQSGLNFHGHQVLGKKSMLWGSNDFYPLDVTRGSFPNLNPIHCCCWLTCDKGLLVSRKKVWRWCESYAVVHQIWTQSRTFRNNWVHQKTKWVTVFYENDVNEVCRSDIAVSQ